MRKETLLRKQKIMHLATIDSKNTPHLVPVWYKKIGKKFYIGTNTKTAKAKNISKNNKVCFCIDIGVWHPIDGMMITGKAKLLRRENIVKKNCRTNSASLFQVSKGKVSKTTTRPD